MDAEFFCYRSLIQPTQKQFKFSKNGEPLAHRFIFNRSNFYNKLF